MNYTETSIDTLCEHYEHVPLELLLQACTRETKKVRLRAITLLSLLQEKTPIKLLLTLLDHRDPGIRKCGIVALGRHFTRIPKDAIADKLKDRRRDVRRVASWTLLRANEDLPTELVLPLLDSPENIARATAIELLGKRAPIERLIAVTCDHKWTVQQAAIHTLGTMGEQVPLEIFLEALCDRNLSVRRAAVIALGNRSEREVIPILLISGVNVGKSA